MMKKYLQFLNEDLFDDEEWDFEEEKPEDEPETVKDYRGNKIPKEESVFCKFGNAWCHEDEALWSESEQNYVTPDNDEFIWIDTRHGGDYIHRDDLAYSNRDGEHYRMEDATWCEHEGDCCLHDDAVECYDGEFAFAENTVVDSEGRTQHKRDVTFDNETGEYIYIR